MLLRFFSSFCSLLLFFFSILGLFFSAQKKFFFLKIKNTFITPTCIKKKIWFHAASVGEVELVKKITYYLQKDFFITTNTLDGLKQAQLFQKHSYIAPFDFCFSIFLWKKNMNPCGLVLIEAELWANLVSVMAKNTPLALINARTTPKLINKIIYKKLLPKFQLVIASTENTATFYRSLVQNLKIYQFGNLKFFMQQTPIQQSLRKYFAKNKFIFLASSLQPEETPIILAAMHEVWKTNQDIFLVLIPRHPQKKKEFLQYLKNEDFQIIETHPPKKIKKRILFLPLLGILKDWYASADSIFIGGSLCNRGGQNMIEALGSGVPTSTGYNTKNFAFAMKLFLAKKAIIEVHNEKDLVVFIQNSIAHPEKFFPQRAIKIIKQQEGSLPKTIQLLNKTFAT